MEKVETCGYERGLGSCAIPDCKTDRAIGECAREMRMRSLSGNTGQRGFWRITKVSEGLREMAVCMTAFFAIGLLFIGCSIIGF